VLTPPAAGKSTIAQLLRARLGRGVAWVEQDYLRRTVLREHDRPGLPNLGLIDVTTRYALDAGYHVIAEGTFGANGTVRCSGDSQTIMTA
jgi:predicted kinase